jgi:hypothetical protein
MLRTSGDLWPDGQRTTLDCDPSTYDLALNFSGRDSYECSTSVESRRRLVRHLQLRHPLPLRVRTATNG